MPDKSQLTVNATVLAKVDKISTVLFYPLMSDSLISMTEESSFGYGKTYTARDALRVLIDVGQGLSVLHDRCSLMHLDLKPNNVLIGTFEDAYRGFIIDFGCASPFDLPLVSCGNKAKRDRVNSTTVYDVFGSEDYKAPSITQQFFNYTPGDAVKVTTKADLYGYAYICWDVIFGMIDGKRSTSPSPRNASKHLGGVMTSPMFQASITAFVQCVKESDYTIQSIIDALVVIDEAL
jgi:serine/threonine protein kinase